VLEHPGAAAEQHRDQVDRELVDQAGPHELLAGVGAAHHRHVLVAGGVASLLEGVLDSSGDEGVDAVGRRVGGLVVGEDEDGDASPRGSSGRRLAAVMNPSRDMLMSKTTLLISYLRR
jgi:hypothetical protein